MTILFAYDGSESAHAALSGASSIVGRDDEHAVVLSVWEPLTVQALRAISFGGPPAVPLDTAELDEDSERAARELADHGARLASDLGYKARAVSVADRENIADTILETADNVDADLIVLGARGLTGVRAFLGSVSNHVLQHAHRPVLVVPPKATEREGAQADQSETTATAS
jgi:nucleotide-binding universal stress UspA family protein